MNLSYRWPVAAALVALGLAATSCSDTDAPQIGAGEGRIVLRTAINSDLAVKSRSAAQGEEELAASTIIWISNAQGPVRKFKGLDQVPMGGIPLLSDHYVVEAWAGDSVSASWDKRYFKGSETVDVTAGSTKQVNITCRIANVVATASFSDGVAEVMSDYSLEVGHSRGTLTFDSETIEDQKGYFMMPSTDKDLNWTLKGTLTTGKPFSLSGSVRNVQPATQYNLHVKHNGAIDNPNGSLDMFEVVVDATEVEVNDPITVVCAPRITGDFDATLGIVGTAGAIGARRLTVAAVTDLTNVDFSWPYLSSKLGLSDEAVELVGADPALVSQLNEIGVNWAVSTDDTGMQTMQISLSAELMNGLPDGTTMITLNATDANERNTSVTIPVVVTSAPVSTLEAISTDVWATRAQLRGSVMNASAQGAAFRYRRSGTQQWIDAAPDQGQSFGKGSTYVASLSGLDPGTEYEYQATAADGGYASEVTARFTTEEASQLPNAGFEEWSTASDKAIIPALSMDDLFWDCGNHGSITLKKNVTTSDATIKHSGEFSAKMASQFVGVFTIGKFAAGNIFVGQYLKTEGMDGLLGWGRPFASRPSKLTGWIKYTPATVTYDSDDYTALKKGDMDKGTVYIAIVDDSHMTLDDYSWPQIVRTKASVRTLFDPQGANVIAYGQLVLDEATPGDAMVQFEIPLDYRRTDLKASNIIVVASASIGGDYFVGGPSVMYLDDLHLEY